MKNTIVLLICILAIATAVSCGDQSSGSSSTAFKIQPGDVSKFDTTISGTSFDVNFDTKDYPTPEDTEQYAIIVSNVNNTGKVGIALGTNPKSNRKFKVYINFDGLFTPGTNNSYSNKLASITVINEKAGEIGKIYQGTFISTIDINFNPDQTYSITFAPNNFTISGKNLLITSIKAYLVQ